MPELDDMGLLEEFVAGNSEEAFATLVRRHVNLVYSVALRQTGNPHKAEDITQAVFIILAQKGRRLPRGTVLTGWLYQTARYTAISFLRGEMRRQQREQESYMQSSGNDPQTEVSWETLAPFLEDAMARLGETERNAVLLRYFEGKSAREAALALGMNEPALKKRVSRAVEKLRKFFVKRGIAVSAGILATTIGANSVQSAPAPLAATAASAAFKGAAVAAPTLTMIEGGLKLMAWSKLKITVVASVIVILTAGTASIVIPKIRQSIRVAAIPPSDRVLNNAFNRVSPNDKPTQMRVEELRATVWPTERHAAEQRIAARQSVDETKDAATVDLTPYINAKLTEAPLGWKGDNANNLSELPKGTHVYGGVPFDVEGTVFLMGGWMEHYKKKYPIQVNNIRVGKKFAKIHVLHGAALVNANRYGITIAKLVLHYSDGLTKDLDFVTGEQSFDWWLPLFTTGVGPRNQQTAAGTEQAWTGSNPYLKKWQPDESLVLYKSTFDNPRPDMLVMTVDYVSAKTPTVPFMAGLTVE